MGKRSLLVHGFSRGDIVAGLPAALGRRGCGIVHSCAPNGVVALASTFNGGDDPEAAFADPETLTALALDHAQVLAGLAAVADIVPLRLGTIVSGEPALALLCERQAMAINDVLDAIAGRIEFGVRVLLRPDADVAPAVQTAASGRSYLRARASERNAKQQISERQSAFCQSLGEHLRTLAEVRTLGADAARAAEGRISDLACLVDRNQTDDLADSIGRLVPGARSIGLDINVTGPWPAYSFVAALLPSNAH